jgi:large subunit ribosomal protein L1
LPAWPDAEPQTGTVTPDVAKAVSDIEVGKINFRVDKHASSKGRCLKKITVSTTTGPGIPVDPAITRNFTEA